ncbi:MAG: hypothetical protein ACR2QC_09455 [Gammaproteobacteria bacterium]
MRKDAGGGFDIDKVLESHFCPPGENSPLSRDDYEEFLQWRQDCVWKAIKRATGAPESGDDSAG